MSITQKRQRDHLFSRSPSDSTSKTGSRTVWTGSGSPDRFITVTYKLRLGSNFSVEGLRRPRRPCRRVPIGLLLLPTWAATVDDACMANRSEVRGHLDDEIRHRFVLVVLAHCTCDVVVLQGSSVSRQVWCPREATEVLARGAFQSIAWLTCMLVEQPWKSPW